MSTPLFRRIAMPAALCLALTAAACGSSTGSVEKYGPQGHLAITSAQPTPQHRFSVDDAAKTGSLVGPHYAVTVAGYSVTRSVSSQQLAEYGFEEGPVKAAEGSEFFLAVMGDTTQPTSGEVEATLVIDGEQTPLERLPEAGESVAAVIPQGAQVELSVTDEERTQTLDLRDGSRGETIEGFYTAAAQSADLDDYQAEGTAVADAGDQYMPEERTVGISMTVGQAGRSPWSSAHGWADEGKVWVTVPVSQLLTDAVWGFDPGKDSHEPKLFWQLKQSELFSLVPEGGKAVDSQGEQTFAADADSEYSGEAESPFGPDKVTVSFEVPQDTTSATFQITPGGTLKAEWLDVKGKVTWEKKPTTGKITVKF